MNTLPSNEIGATLGPAMSPTPVGPGVIPYNPLAFAQFERNVMFQLNRRDGQAIWSNVRYVAGSAMRGASGEDPTTMLAAVAIGFIARDQEKRNNFSVWSDARYAIEQIFVAAKGGRPRFD